MFLGRKLKTQWKLKENCKKVGIKSNYIYSIKNIPSDFLSKNIHFFINY